MKRFLLLSLVCLSFSYTYAQYSIGQTSITFNDPDRFNRSVNTRIYYPQNSVNETFPVVVLGHGFVMGYDAYQNFYDELVPRGYIVAFVNTEGSFFANHDAYSKDLAFIAEAVQGENSDQSSVLYNIVSDKTALMGHSMGGGAATVAASLTEVETLVTFAPALLRFDTLTPASQVTEDAVVFSGTSDAVTSPGTNHIPVYDNLGSSCKYMINIIGGAHCYYANSNFFCDFGEISSGGNIQVTRPEQQETTFQFLNSWLDYKLKGDFSAKQTFESDLGSSSDITPETNCSRLVQNVSDKLELRAFPNPTNGMLNFELSEGKKLSKVEFYSSNGGLIRTFTSDKMNVSDMKPGNYFTKIYVGNTVLTKNILVQE